MKNFLLNTAFNIGRNPSERAGRFALNLGLYLFILIAIGFGIDYGFRLLDNGSQRYSIFIPIAGFGFLLLQTFAALLLKDNPYEYIDRLFEVSRNGVIFPACALPFILFFPETDFPAVAMVYLLVFTYLFVWLGHFFILIKTKSSMIWYLIFVLNRIIAILGSAFIAYGFE